VFRATVHGLVFADRTRCLDSMRPGDDLMLIPDPPGSRSDQVWVHLAGGDPVGHLPNEIGRWLAPWMRRGGRVRATTVKVGNADVPSWKRLLIEVSCSTPITSRR
jgi:hypothetical protein